METYQDLLNVGQSDAARADFCLKAVREFMNTQDYINAKIGDSYYNKHNLTIEAFQKTLFTLSGRQVSDIFSANYKLKTLFFRRLVTQQVQYVLGNGMNLEEPENKAKLGKDFDFKLQKAAKRAMAGGRAYGFWNLDHLEVFGFADHGTEPGFCPLYDEGSGALRAGIRFWFRQVGDKQIFRATLYEEDGYTDYRKSGNNPCGVLVAKRAYKTITSQTAYGIDDICGENYGALPIVELYANDSRDSELVGLRECIDCYDYIKSGLANDIDDTAGFYWTLTGAGGMEDTDLAQFVQRMKTVKAAVVDGDDGVSAEAHTLDVPVAARTAMLDILRRDIYEDFQALDVSTLSASAKTATEIQAAYQAQDNKCAEFEYNVIDFCQRILTLAGIEDNPTFTWNRIVNQSEQTNMILAAANYLDDETVLRKLPFLTPEEVDFVIQHRDVQDFMRFNAGDNEAGEE